MKQIAVVTGAQDFEVTFRQGSPFVRGIDYFPHMLKTELCEHGYELVSYDEVRDFKQICAIYHKARYRMDVIKAHPDKIHFYVAGELPIVVPCNRIKMLPTLADKVYDAVLNNHAKKINHERIFPFYFPVDTKYLRESGSNPSKLACLFSGDKTAFGRELYSLRRKVIRYAEKNLGEDFRFFGPNWGKPYASYNCYGGVASDKSEAAKPYKFMFCFENEYGTPNCYSEKLFDAMTIGKVPIYLGVPNITDYVPKECFIDYSKFQSIAECFEYLKQMSETEYFSYLNAIKRFMTDTVTKDRFSARLLSETIIQICEHVTPHKKRHPGLLRWFHFEERCYSALCKGKKIIIR